MGRAIERLRYLVGGLFGRDPMRHRQEEAIKIYKRTGGKPQDVADAYGVPLPEVPEEKGEGTDGS